MIIVDARMPGSFNYDSVKTSDAFVLRVVENCEIIEVLDGSLGSGEGKFLRRGIGKFFGVEEGNFLPFGGKFFATSRNFSNKMWQGLENELQVIQGDDYVLFCAANR